MASAETVISVIVFQVQRLWKYVHCADQFWANMRNKCQEIL